MRNEDEILSEFSEIRKDTLHVWIEKGWLSPKRGRRGYQFQEIDVARLRLISEFRSDLELNEDALDVILPLIDQVHGLRRELRRLVEAINAQPASVRSKIVEMIHKSE